MVAHVTSTSFLPGLEVSLYSCGTRPQPSHRALATETVPDSSQVVFELGAFSERRDLWIAGTDSAGRWRAVRVMPKRGEPTDVRRALAAEHRSAGAIPVHHGHDASRLRRGR